MMHVTVAGGETFDLERADTGDWKLEGDAASDTSMVRLPDRAYSIIKDGKSYVARVEEVNRQAKTVTVRIGEVPYTVSIEEPLDRLLKEMGIDNSSAQKAEPVKAPMPGLILRILVQPGQAIEKGDGLIVLEAMKMENVLKATAAGTVRAVHAVEKTTVEKGTVLIEME